MERRTTAKQLYEQRKNYARSSNIKAETAQYHVEHLSTFEMDRKEGLVNLEDGIRRLRLLDSTGKIWTQDMLLQVDERSVSLVDIESKEELENFTLVSIMSCQAVLTEPNYSSILALTCTDVGQARPDLHLFHCVEVGAELIKNDIDSAIADSKDGRKNRRPETLRFNQERMRMSPSPAPGAASIYSESHSPASNRSRTPNDSSTLDRDSDRFSVYSQDSDETPEMMAKRVDRDVQILNHLLDDIELFVARLQKSAEAYGELSKRKKEKKGKRKGEGVLTLRSKPPPPGEFREILQKFKYCFNLLARLKGHIQNPDSIELVHFLFTPLEMVGGAEHGGPDLARLITSPLLTRDCIDMLHGCLTAKERELWKSCGDAWNKSKAEWPRDQHVPPYVPRFRSGWEPPLLDVPVRERERERAREHVAELADGRGGAPPAHHYNEPPWMHSEPDGAAHLPTATSPSDSRTPTITACCAAQATGFNQERMRMSPSPAPGAASIYSESHSPASNRSRTPNDSSTLDRDSDRFSVYSQDSDETPEMMAKRVDRDVQILNHLLDDIELFVARLQKSAEAYGELSKRKKEKKGKRKGEGVLTLRSKPPPPGEFREILQKFKYCFNLLARLKGHIQNPDSIELVHFLFTPLEMVVQSTGGPDLARLITSPLLTRDCIDMLHGCLTAKERELWKSCGDAWNKSKAEWPRDQHVPPYVPRFRSGWEPPLLDVPVRERERERAREHVAELADGRGGAPPAHHYNEPPWMHSEPDGAAHLPNNGYVAFGQPDPYHHGLLPPGDRGFDGSAAPPPRSPLGPQTAIVRYDFMARNSNELAVRKDDLVEVIENSKQWWKVRSVTGHEGYVPNNILDLLKGGGDGIGGGGGVGLHDEPLYSRALQKQRTDSSSHYPGPASPGLPLPPNGLQRQGSVDSANAAGPEPPRGNNNNNQRDPASQHVQEELLKRLTGQNVNKRNFMIPRSKGTAVVLSFDSSPDDVKSWLVAKGFNNLTVDSLGVLTGAQIFSLNKEELKAVCPDEGARVYSQITVQKSALESARGTSELEEIMKKRKEKISSVDKNGSENVTA
ncbi:epidermal growth factor receptor kinase substrate 8-like [Lethenteron reissneri]|uniref:epidermal growth factor receptor kinase substrate 8-like n=1 Tax=Lethenteron reissneri TaxID=7753 RepID=UPI002AB64F03|nr:epidermal growth factor receptor kinase substrate 8-like [Lethenteron reissneri]